MGGYDMNNRRIGKFAVTAIVGIISAISGIASMEMLKSIRKETETKADCSRNTKDNNR
jgi:hypothetical protein